MSLLKYLEGLRSLDRFNVTFDQNGVRVKIRMNTETVVAIIDDGKGNYTIDVHYKGISTQRNLNELALSDLESTLIHILELIQEHKTLNVKQMWKTLSRLSDIVEKLATRDNLNIEL